MQNLKRISLFFATIFLASCSSTLPEQSIAQTIVASPSQTWYSTPTITLIPTPRPSTPTTEPSPKKPVVTSTPALPPENVLKYQRLDITTTLPTTDSGLEGELALVAIGGDARLVQFSQHSQRELPSKGFCLSTSPNREWLSYCQSATDSPTGVWLIVEGANGKQRAKLAVGRDWWWDFAVSWLDNERIMFNVWQDRLVAPTILPVVLVNPFTGEQQRLESNYPDLQPSTAGPQGSIPFVYNTVVYHPSLNLVVYPQTVKDGDFVVLWDRQTQKALARVRELGVFLHTPIWSPDGDQFFIAVGNHQGHQRGEFIEEWVSVSQEGQVQPLTHFGDFFSDARIGAGSLSPDGLSLAFWLDAKPSLCAGENLAVLKIGAKQVTNYCVPGSYQGGTTTQPVWSPDSRHIAIGNIYKATATHVILVNIEQAWAAQIGEDSYPMGWLVDP